MTNYRNWIKQNKDLFLGEEPVSSIAKKFGTPLYLYDGEIAANRLRLIREAFPGFEILYSLKANPNPAIAQILSKSGAGADVASPQEIKFAREAGFASSKITFGGPGKLGSELRDAVHDGIGLIDVESKRELEILEEIGEDYPRAIPVTLRINTKYHPPIAGEIMAGVGTQLGIDEETLSETIGRSKPNHVTYEGIHVHVASQVLESSSLLDHYKNTAKLSIELASTLNFELKVVNFGGGLGVPYSPKDPSLDLTALGRETQEMLSRLYSGTNAKPKFQLELGRFLVAECGIFLTEIVEVKRSRGSTFVITDTGINGLTRPVMSWAQQHPCTIVSKEGEKPMGSYKVVGRSCLPGDILRESVELPDPQPGDILAIHNAGAYGYTMSMLLWSSHKIPREILFFDGRTKEISTNRTPELS